MTVAELENKEIWTLEEVCAYSGFSTSAIYKLTSQRIVPHFKPSGQKLFFQRDAFKAWLMSNPIATDSQLQSTAILKAI